MFVVDIYIVYIYIYNIYILYIYIYIANVLLGVSEGTECQLQNKCHVIHRNKRVACRSEDRL